MRNSNEPADLGLHLRRLSNFEQVSPKLWQDAYLAAFACAGNHSLVTFDQGFRKFTGVRLILLGN
jgi:predicted nucleic acid-binding protein